MNLPETVNLLVVGKLEESELARIRAVAPERLNVQMVPNPGQSPELNALARTAHILYMNSTNPRDLADRIPEALWAHFFFAGVSNLKGTSWWHAPLMITSTRGYNHPLPLAESVIAGIFTFARGFDVAVRNTAAHDFRHASYPPISLVDGKTLGIIGLGGIGAHLARIARGCGMRVVASRLSARERREDVEGVDVLYPAAELQALLAESDYVALCAMWTPQTERMIDRDAIAAMKPNAVFLNVARGEMVDEGALVGALHSGKVRGAFLDVWDDIFSSPPSEALQNAPNVILTPHTSNRAEISTAYSLDLFCKNLDCFLNGKELDNVVDWDRGY